jgi:hypothetical protein
VKANRSLISEPEGGFRVVVPEPDESVRGYMYRLSEAYGLPSVRTLLDQVRVGGPRPFSTACVARLAELGGVPHESVLSLAGFDSDYSGGVNVWRFGRDHTSHFPGVNCRMLPMCSECLADRGAAHGFVPGFVHLAAMTACPLHGCVLLKVCPYCNVPLRADRVRLHWCGCRSAIDRLVPKKASPGELTFASAIYARISGTRTPASVLNSENGQLDLAALTLDDLVYLQWALGHVLPRPIPSALGSRRHLSAAQSLAATLACVELLSEPNKVVPLVRRSLWVGGGAPVRSVQVGAETAGTDARHPGNRGADLDRNGSAVESSPVQASCRAEGTCAVVSVRK